MKICKIVTASALAAVMTVSLCRAPVSATSELFFESGDVYNGEANLEITSNFQNSITMPLTLEASSPVFYCNANLSPGDIAKSSVIIDNISDRNISISITEIENMLPDDKKANMLLDILELTIDIDGTPYYQGKHSELSAPFMPYVTVEPNKPITLNISMNFPREADNRYQGAKYEMKWVFDAIAEEPDPEPEPLPKPKPIIPPEPAKTGVETSSSPIAPVAAVASAVGLSAAISAIVIKKRRKK